MKLISEDGNTRTFWVSNKVKIVEQAPSYRTINVRNMSYEPYERRHYHIFLPYKVFVIRSNLKHPRYKNKELTTMHLGLRVSSLCHSMSLDEELLFPPIPNIYKKWMLVCGHPSVQNFWQSEFNNNPNWFGLALQSKTELKSFENWQKLSPNQCMKIFEEWPSEVSGRNDDDPIWFHESSHLKIPARFPISECLRKIGEGELMHVCSVGRQI